MEQDILSNLRVPFSFSAKSAVLPERVNGLDVRCFNVARKARPRAEAESIG